ncbi:MAG: hypothetical protein J1E39_09965 [Eubacterium sp.]|nr:hypothetical protein [Eubacterium sp.]
MKIKAQHIFLVIAASALSALLMSCSVGNTESSDGGTSATSSTAPTAAATTAETTAATTAQTTTVTTAEQTTTATESVTTTTETDLPETDEPEAPPQTTPAVPSQSSAPEKKPWKETEHIEELYVNTLCYSRARAEIGSLIVNVYYANEKVKVVAETDTGYYKLDNGEYIHSDFLNGGIYLVFTTSSSAYRAAPIPEKLPEDTDKVLEYYDPRLALDYASRQWDSGMGHCAAFAQACMAAGGIHGLTDIGSTPLYNQLLASGLGYAIKLERGHERYVVAPEEAFPGDILFYYCPIEDCMVHTAVYNGLTKDGYVKAYAHNLEDDGQSALWYYRLCPDGCIVQIDTLALFSFYRNPDVMREPDNPPTLSVTTKDSSGYFEWDADFLYSNSELVVLNEKGKEVYRGMMGTDKENSLMFYSTEKYTAYIEMQIGKDIVVKSNEVTFNVEKAAVKPRS